MSFRDLGKIAMRGAIDIFIGKITSKIIGVVGGIVLLRMLSPEDFGSIIIATSAPNIAVLFADFGIDTAVMKFVSEGRERRDTDTIRYIFYSGAISKIVLCSILTTICFLASDIYASSILGKIYVAPLIKLSSVLVFGWIISNFSESILMGLDLTRYYALFMVVAETFLSVAPILLLILIGGPTGVLYGMVLATLLSCCLELITCFILVRKLDKTSGISSTISFSKGIRNALRKILVFGAPLQIVIMLSFGLGRFYDLITDRYVTSYEVGQYGVAQRTNAFIDYFAWPVSIVIFPMFSKVDFREHSTRNRAIFKYSIKYPTVVILPAALGLLLFGKPLTVFLFGAEYEYAWNYLTFLLISWFYYGLASVQLRKLLLSQGNTKFVTLIDLVTVTISLPLAFILVQIWGIFGIIATQLVVHWPAYILIYRKARRDYGIELPVGDLARAYVSAAIAGLAVLPIAMLQVNALVKLLGGSILLFLIYVLATLLTRAVTMVDIDNLRTIEISPHIDKVIHTVIDFIESLIRFLGVQ